MFMTNGEDVALNLAGVHCNLAWAGVDTEKIQTIRATKPKKSFFFVFSGKNTFLLKFAQRKKWPIPMAIFFFI